jgi:hypothetical protein
MPVASVAAAVPPQQLDRLRDVVTRFVAWLSAFGPTSHDHQTLYAGPVGAPAKQLYYRHKRLGTAAVAPLVFAEAFLPSVRRFLGPKWRFPIADAHYAMGFAMLSERAGDAHHARAVEFLHSLEERRSPGYERYCWGYPFDWVTQGGTLPAWTPFITSTPYGYEAFRAVYELDRNERWLNVCRSAADHGLRDIPDCVVSDSVASAGYSPHDTVGGVVNAAAYRAWLLTAAATDFGDEQCWQAARRNVNFVTQAQQPNGSWYYAVDGKRDFVDHFHTCFVLKALAKIERRLPGTIAPDVLERGVAYYAASLFDGDGLPKPFSKAPRFTAYKRELYDYAECVNVCLLLGERHPVLQDRLRTVVNDLLERWVKRDGSFRSRQLLAGWDNVPMHRWAQSQLFRSLAFLLQQARTDQQTAPQAPVTTATAN